MFQQPDQFLFASFLVGNRFWSKFLQQKMNKESIQIKSNSHSLNMAWRLTHLFPQAFFAELTNS